MLHGARTFVLQDEDGQTVESHSISAGLDYPGVGPEHAWLHATGRARYEGVTDTDAMDAMALLGRTEGIIPAIESAHALAGALREGRRLGPDGVVLVNLSGRGDKDVDTAAAWFGLLDDPYGGPPRRSAGAEHSDAGRPVTGTRSAQVLARRARRGPRGAGRLPAGRLPRRRRLRRGRQGAASTAGSTWSSSACRTPTRSMDGPVIQQAATRRCARAPAPATSLATPSSRSPAHGRDAAVVVMTYWNPVLRYGVDAFAARPRRRRRRRAHHARPDAGRGPRVARGGRRARPRPGLPGRAVVDRRSGSPTPSPRAAGSSTPPR